MASAMLVCGAFGSTLFHVGSERSRRVCELVPAPKPVPALVMALGLRLGLRLAAEEEEALGERGEASEMSLIETRGMDAMDMRVAEWERGSAPWRESRLEITGLGLEATDTDDEDEDDDELASKVFI